MSVTSTVIPIESELWPQRDARDPLGIFGWRTAIATDASGGFLRVQVNIEASKRHAFVWKIWDMVIAQITGGAQATNGKLRILSNWPNIDPQAGIQAYASLYIGSMGGNNSLSFPNTGLFDVSPLNGNQKDILIYDPSTQSGAMPIAEQEVVNINGLTYSFEGYGYYWDRSVMNTPGGPRNPGTS